MVTQKTLRTREGKDATFKLKSTFATDVDLKETFKKIKIPQVHVYFWVTLLYNYHAGAHDMQRMEKKINYGCYSMFIQRIFEIFNVLALPYSYWVGPCQKYLR